MLLKIDHSTTHTIAICHYLDKRIEPHHTPSQIIYTHSHAMCTGFRQQYHDHDYHY